MLASLCATPLVLSAGSLVLNGGRESTLVLFDGQIARARLAGERAEAAGLRTADTRGEVALMLLQRMPDLPPAIIGVTGYSEMVLARDILRSNGRPMQDVLQFGTRDTWHSGVPSGSPALRDVANLMRHTHHTQQARATGFAWLA